MKLLHTHKGFTLVELVIGMAIVSLVMAGLYGVLSSSIKAYQYSQKRTYEIQQARRAFNEIADDLRIASIITTPDKGSTAPQITYSIGASTYTISLGTGSFANTVVRNTTEQLTTNIVESLSFQRDAADGRLITFTMSINDPENTSTGRLVMTTSVFVPNMAP